MKNNARRKKLHSTNKYPIFFEAVSATETMKEPESNLEKKGSPSILKKIFFFKNRSIHFHINSIRVFRLLKQNKVSFSSIEPDPVYSVLWVKVQKPNRVVAINQRPAHT